MIAAIQLFSFFFLSQFNTNIISFSPSVHFINPVIIVRVCIFACQSTIIHRPLTQTYVHTYIYVHCICNGLIYVCVYVECQLSIGQNVINHFVGHDSDTYTLTRSFSVLYELLSLLAYKWRWGIKFWKTWKCQIHKVIRSGYIVGYVHTYVNACVHISRATTRISKQTHVFMRSVLIFTFRLIKIFKIKQDVRYMNEFLSYIF